jgi:exopolyphosphatase/guanosine-5'-triphosphate,3'-diphosphate pyrophosphatase
MRDRPARPGRRPHRPARRRGAGAHLRGDRRVRRRSGAPAPERVRFCATSATRDAANRDEFAAGVRERLGVEPEVVSGDEEAELSFDGATRELLGSGRPAVPRRRHRRRLDRADPRRLPRSPDRGHSIDIGSVRMHERHLHDDPPTADAGRRLRADIDAAPRRLPGDRAGRRGRTVVGVAGTVTTVAAMACSTCRRTSRERSTTPLPADDVRSVAQRLLAMTHDERAALPFMHPGRVDVIGAGALILAASSTASPSTRLVMSEHDILDGIAWAGRGRRRIRTRRQGRPRAI